MLTSFAIIFLVGMTLGWLSRCIKLPTLMGLILTGIIIGPNVLNLVDNSILDISAELRQIALVIILTRAGLSLDISELKKVGRPAFLMCFVPATCEIISTIIFAPILFHISHMEAALLGSVIAAVSPAVIVPGMIKTIDQGYGVNKQIPQIVLAGASADDVYVIVLFTAFCSILSGENVSALNFVQIPTSIILGIILGILVALALVYLFKKYHFRDSVKVVIIISFSFLILAFEDKIEQFIQISGLIAIMTMGMTFLAKYAELAKRLSQKYNKLWIVGEIILFVLVGTIVELENVTKYGFTAIIFLFIALLFRMSGVLISLIKTKLSFKEKLFCMISYSPKATVQAAIGAIPLSMGFECGEIILTIAVLAIVITAPLGAFFIDLSYKKLLSK